MAWTETLQLDSNVASVALDGATKLDVLSKAFASAQASATRAAALGDQRGFEVATRKAAALGGEIDALKPTVDAEAEAAKRSAAMHDMLADGLKVAASAALAAGVAVASTVAKLAYEGAKLAISAADAKGDLLLLFNVMGEGAYTGEQAVAMLDKLGAELGATRAELAPMAQAFAAMGVTSTEQLESLTRAAMSANVLAKGGGQAFEAMFKKIDAAAQTGQALKIPLKGMGSLASMGLKVDDVAQQMGVSAKVLGDQLAKGTVDAKKFGKALQDSLIKKGAGPLADNALDIERTWARAKEAVAKMFEDVDVAPFLAALKDLFGVLDGGTESGKAMKAGVTGAFNAIFKAAAAALPVVKQVFLSLVIYGLKAYIAMKQVYNAIAAFAASEEGKVIIEQLGFALQAAAVTAGILVAAILAVVGVVAIAGAAVAGLVTGFVMASAAITAWAVSAAESANDFVQGLVNGIVQGGAQVLTAVTGLAATAKQAFMQALGIASPSKVMMGLGVNMGEGVAAGLDSSSATVADATQGVAATSVDALASSPAPGGGAAAGGVGGVVVTVEPGAIVINGGGGASAVELTESAVAMIFERVALAQGLA